MIAGGAHSLDCAADYRPNFRQAVFEGCLDGLPNP